VEALSASVIGCHSVSMIESPNNATNADLLPAGPPGRASSALWRSVDNGGRPGRRSPSRLGAENLAQPGSERSSGCAMASARPLIAPPELPNRSTGPPITAMIACRSAAWSSGVGVTLSSWRLLRTDVAWVVRDHRSRSLILVQGSRPCRPTLAISGGKRGAGRRSTLGRRVRCPVTRVGAPCSWKAKP